MVSKKILQQPGFNRWSYYHKARKYARILERMSLLGAIEDTGHRSPYAIESLMEHYVDLCWDRDSTLMLASDARYDRAVHHNNTKYLRWASTHKWYVGKIIKITEQHSHVAKEYGVGEEVRVTKIVSALGNRQGFPRIMVERVRDGFTKCRNTGDSGTPRAATYDACRSAFTAPVPIPASAGSR